MDDHRSPEERLAADRISVVSYTPPRVHDGQLFAQPFVMRPSHEIPPREWLMGTTAVRGFITLLVAPGGVGKTTYAMTADIALVIGRALLGEHIFQRANAWLLNLEDPREEMERRVTAAMIQHGIYSSEVEGRLFLNSGRDRRVMIASKASPHDGLDTKVAYPDKARIIAEAKRLGIGLIAVDPFINSHELDENSNPDMNAAARAWAEVATEAGCAVLLVHHTRKGAAEAGDIESGRGAKALADASRVGLTLTAMTTQEAGQCGVPISERWRHIRLDSAKASMAPQADKAKWFRLTSIELGNGTMTYPNGDSVQSIEPWTPPSAFGETSVAAINAVLDQIAKGPDDGRRFTANKAGPNGAPRWAGHLLVERLNRTEEQAKVMIAVWLKTGLLFQKPYRDRDTRKDVQGLFVNDDQRPGRECGTG